MFFLSRLRWAQPRPQRPWNLRFQPQPAVLGLDLQSYPPPGTFSTCLPHPFPSTRRQSKLAHTGSPHMSPLRFLAPTRARVLGPQISDVTRDAPCLSAAVPPGSQPVPVSCIVPLPFLLPADGPATWLTCVVCPSHLAASDFPSRPREKFCAHSLVPLPGPGTVVTSPLPGFCLWAKWNPDVAKRSENATSCRPSRCEG